MSRDAVREHFITQGRRFTIQRRAVLQALRQLGCAHDAETIFARAREIYPRLGRVTVYRTLDALIQEGLAQAVVLEPGRMRYELADEGSHHHHLVCLNCRTVTRLDACELAVVERRARRRGFQVTTHRLELFGYCGSCRQAEEARGRDPQGAAR